MMCSSEKHKRKYLLCKYSSRKMASRSMKKFFTRMKREISMKIFMHYESLGRCSSWYSDANALNKDDEKFKRNLHNFFMKLCLGNLQIFENFCFRNENERKGFMLTEFSIRNDSFFDMTQNWKFVRICYVCYCHFQDVWNQNTK
jgi:hypothetical protein